MRQRTQKLLWTAALLSALLSMASGADARRTRYRPQPVSSVAEDDDQQYYQQPAAAAATQVETEQAGVVLVSSDPYNGLYGRQTDSSPAPRYRGSAATRSALAATGAPRTKEPKQPPVQTIRNYSKVNDDGSFTFGYEAADGSFKEETRGTDCVVRGKYGYVDPDGNKREFTYVSGNPCDPNNPEARDPQQSEEEEDSGEENIPKVPIRPLRPLRPTVPTPSRPQTTTTVFQNDYRQEQSAEDAVDDEPQQLYTAQPGRAAYSVPSTSSLYHQYGSSHYTTPAPVVYRTQPQHSVSITPRPRPAVAPSTVRSQLPATTYRPQLLATATPRPQSTTTQLYSRLPSVYQSSTSSPYSTPYSTAARSQAQLYGRTTSLYQPSSTVATASAAQVDFDEELRKFQLENNVVTTPRTLAASVSPTALTQRVHPVQHAQLVTSRPQPVVQQARKVPPTSAPSSDPIYSSELVYDPSTGQYNTVLYQALPQTQGGELNLRASIQPYVAPQQSQQQYFQQLLQSQQLYAQQRQRSRYEVTTPPAPTPAAARQQQYRQAQVHQSPQTYYYVAAPAGPAAAAPSGRESLSHGQIDAFLRGHNIAF